MTRTYARAARGQRVHDTVPGGHWKMLTILGAMDHTGMLAAMTVEAATDREVFLAYLDEVLCPKLRPGHVVVMDNLSAHKVDGVRQRIEARGASVLYLPPYSPDLNPIEKAGSKLKQAMRATAARSTEALQQAVAHLLPTITAKDATAWFRVPSHLYTCEVNDLGIPNTGLGQSCRSYKYLDVETSQQIHALRINMASAGRYFCALSRAFRCIAKAPTINMQINRAAGMTRK